MDDTDEGDELHDVDERRGSPDETFGLISPPSIEVLECILMDGRDETARNDAFLVALF